MKPEAQEAFEMSNWVVHEGGEEEQPEGDLKAGRRGAKAPLHEIPLWALHGVARVFDYGGRKYAPGNYVLAASEENPEAAVGDYADATLRHLGAIQQAIQNGKLPWDCLDEESGLPHWDHALCSMIMGRAIAQKAGVMDQDPGQGK